MICLNCEATFPITELFYCRNCVVVICDRCLLKNHRDTSNHVQCDVSSDQLTDLGQKLLQDMDFFAKYDPLMKLLNRGVEEMEKNLGSMTKANGYMDAVRTDYVNGFKRSVSTRALTLEQLSNFRMLSEKNKKTLTVTATNLDEDTKSLLQSATMFHENVLSMMESGQMITALKKYEQFLQKQRNSLPDIIPDVAGLGIGDGEQGAGRLAPLLPPQPPFHMQVHSDQVVRTVGPSIVANNSYTPRPQPEPPFTQCIPLVFDSSEIGSCEATHRPEYAPPVPPQPVITPTALHFIAGGGIETVPKEVVRDVANAATKEDSKVPSPHPYTLPQSSNQLSRRSNAADFGIAAGRTDTTATQPGPPCSPRQPLFPDVSPPGSGPAARVAACIPPLPLPPMHMMVPPAPPIGSPNGSQAIPSRVATGATTDSSGRQNLLDEIRKAGGKSSLKSKSRNTGRPRNDEKATMAGQTTPTAAAGGNYMDELKQAMTRRRRHISDSTDRQETPSDARTDLRPAMLNIAQNMPKRDNPSEYNDSDNDENRDEDWDD